MPLLRYTIAGFAFLSLASCSENLQQSPESTTETGQMEQANARSQNAGSPMAANDGGESALSAGAEVSHESAHEHAVTEHTAERGHRGEHRGNPATTDGSKRAGRRTKTIKVGDTVPDFEVTLDGRTWSLSELRKNRNITPDGTLVLTFWCSFCHSCRDIERDLDRLARRYHGQAGVIALDASFGETRQAVAAFARKKGLTMPIALNASGSAADIFGVSSTTTTAVIDSTGTLRYLGQFRDRRDAYAHEALKAVLAGTKIAVRSTRPKG